MDKVRDLIARRLQELDLSMIQVSQGMGRNAAYLQQFLYRGSPATLREPERLRLAEILEVDPEALRSDEAALPPRGDGIVRRNHRHDKRNQKRLSGSEQFLLEQHRSGVLTNDLPVYGTREGPNETIIFIADKPIDWTARPVFMSKADGPYSFQMAGDSMDPEIKRGRKVLVDPHDQPRPGDTCVFRADESKAALAIVKVLIAIQAKHWMVEQHNPKKREKLLRSEWPVCHVVSGVHYRR